MQAGSTPTSTDSALLAELALSRGDLVQEWGYDDDVDVTFRDALEGALGEENRGATHAGSPAWTTSIPKAMPRGNRPRPAPNVTATPERTSAHREGGAEAREDADEEPMMVSMLS